MVKSFSACPFCVILVVGLFMASCGGGDTQSSDADGTAYDIQVPDYVDDVPVDMGSELGPPESGPEVTDEGTEPEDVGPEDPGYDGELPPNCPGAAGCPCKINNDCYSGFCVDTTQAPLKARGPSSGSPISSHASLLTCRIEALPSKSMFSSISIMDRASLCPRVNSFRCERSGSN